METYRELMNRLEEGFGSMISIDLETVSEDTMEFGTIPKILRSQYKLSKKRLVVFDCVGNKIMDILRYVPKNGGTIMYNTYEVISKVYA